MPKINNVSKLAKKHLVYLDNASTTEIDSRLLSAMNSFLKDKFMNPSALYSGAREVKNELNKAREKVAEQLKTNAGSIIFTSGGTEANNLAILGAVERYKKFGKHIITTEIEHPSVLEPIKKLERDGFKITYIKPDKNGFVSPQSIKNALTKDTILVSVMYANNEIGTIEPIAEIGRELLKWKKNNKTIFPLFHSDACQAAGFLDLAVEKLHVDLMTLNGSKIYGPKGVGALFKKRGVEIEPLIWGGSQENGYRAGTENVAGIIGFARALELAQIEKDSRIKQIKNIVDYFWNKLNKSIDGVELNGAPIGEKRLVNNLNINFEGIEAELLTFYLNELGIICSTGSACSAENGEISYVLKSCGVSDKKALSSVRFSFGKSIQKKDIDYVIRHLPRVVDMLKKTKKMEQV